MAVAGLQVGVKQYLQAVAVCAIAGSGGIHMASGSGVGTYDRAWPQLHTALPYCPSALCSTVCCRAACLQKRFRHVLIHDSVLTHHS